MSCERSVGTEDNFSGEQEQYTGLRSKKNSGRHEVASIELIDKIDRIIHCTKKLLEID